MPMSAAETALRAKAAGFTAEAARITANDDPGDTNALAAKLVAKSESAAFSVTGAVDQHRRCVDAVAVYTAAAALATSQANALAG